MEYSHDSQAFGPAEPDENLTILCYGFGLGPYLFDRLERVCSDGIFDANWEIILPSGHHEDFIKMESNFRRSFNIARLISNHSCHDSQLAVPLSGPIVADLDVEKRPIRNRARREQRAHLLQNVLVGIFEQRSPGVLLFSQPVETSEAKATLRVAKDYGWQVLVPHHTRYFDRSYFSDFEGERPISDSGRRTLTSQEETFLLNFLNQTSVPNLYSGAEPELVAGINVVGRRQALRRTLKRLRYDRQWLELQNLRVSLFTTWVPWLWRLIQLVRSARARKLFNTTLDQLETGSFVYYPLQYTPESSINMHSPFFVDQLRAIDLIRQSLPPGRFLVVKEHPAALGVRPTRVMRQIMRKVGVRVIPVNTLSKDVTKSACITISVTGTPALEARLLGCRSATLARTFFSSFVPVVNLLEDGRKQIEQLLEDEIDENSVKALVASVFDGTSDFVAAAPEFLSRSISNENLVKFGLELRSKLWRSTQLP